MAEGISRRRIVASASRSHRVQWVASSGWNHNTRPWHQSA